MKEKIKFAFDYRTLQRLDLGMVRERLFGYGFYVCGFSEGVLDAALPLGWSLKTFEGRSLVYNIEGMLKISFYSGNWIFW